MRECICLCVEAVEETNKRRREGGGRIAEVAGGNDGRLEETPFADISRSYRDVQWILLAILFGAVVHDISTSRGRSIVKDNLTCWLMTS